MKHKHYDMICAKAANMDLVVFVKNESTGEWWWLSGDLPFNKHQDFFLCLPQHKDAVLAGLNGSNLEYLDEDDLEEGGDGWHSAFVNEWSETHWYMREPNIQIRIKPRKEKRYVVIHKGLPVRELFELDADIRSSYGAEYHELQIFEIEVEI